MRFNHVRLCGHERVTPLHHHGRPCHGFRYSGSLSLLLALRLRRPGVFNAHGVIHLGFPLSSIRMSIPAYNNLLVCKVVSGLCSLAASPLESKVTVIPRSLPDPKDPEQHHVVYNLDLTVVALHGSMSRSCIRTGEPRVPRI